MMIWMFKLTRLVFICSKSTMGTPEQYKKFFKVNNKDSRTRHWRHSGVFIINFEQILNFVFGVSIVMNKEMQTGNTDFSELVFL